MFRDRQILRELSDLNERVESLYGDLNALIGRFNEFIITDRQRYNQMKSQEAKILAGENHAYEIGYEHGYREARKHMALVEKIESGDSPKSV